MKSRTSTLKHGLLAVLIGLSLTACQPTPKFLNTNITASNLHTDMPLTTQNGEPLQVNAPQKGKISAVFYGYTQCPEICPTTLGKMKLVMQQLGADADKVRVVFITVDPERDTPDVLKAYMAAFNPSFIGAYTDPSSTQKMAKQFQVVYEKEGAEPNYIVNHTANLYLLDEHGKTIVSAPYEAKPEAIAHDIKQMLAAQQP